MGLPGNRRQSPPPRKFQISSLAFSSCKLPKPYALERLSRYYLFISPEGDKKQRTYVERAESNGSRTTFKHVTITRTADEYLREPRPIMETEFGRMVIDTLPDHGVLEWERYSFMHEGVFFHVDQFPKLDWLVLLTAYGGNNVRLPPPLKILADDVTDDVEFTKIMLSRKVARLAHT